MPVCVYVCVCVCVCGIGCGEGGPGTYNDLKSALGLDACVCVCDRESVCGVSYHCLSPWGWCTLPLKTHVLVAER